MKVQGVYGLLTFAICVALAGCAVVGTPRLDTPALITEATRALQRASEAGAAETDRATYDSASGKLSQARRLLTKDPVRARNFAQSALVEAQLAEAVAWEQRAHRAEEKMEAAVVHVRNRLRSHGS